MRGKAHMNVKLWAVAPASPGGLVNMLCWAHPKFLTLWMCSGTPGAALLTRSRWCVLRARDHTVRIAAIRHLEHSQNRPISGDSLHTIGSFTG